MKAGIDYATAAQLPTDADLFRRLLPMAERLATHWGRKYGLPDPEGAAANAVTNVVVERRYQERWKPGEDVIDNYLFTMVKNRLRDAVRSHKRRQDRECSMPTDDEGVVIDRGQLDDRFDTVETLADIARLRKVVAAVGEDTGAVPLTALFDEIAGRSLVNASSSSRQVGLAMGASHTTVMAKRHRLRELLEAPPAPRAKRGEPLPTDVVTKAELKRLARDVFRELGVPTPSLSYYLTKAELVTTLDRIEQRQPIGDLLAIAQGRKDHHKRKGA